MAFVKTVLHSGDGTLPTWSAGDKAVFHFRVERGDDNRLLDDSRELALGPFELRLGKGFALGVWEDMVKTMSVGEKARFTVKPDACTSYAQVGVALREESKRKRPPTTTAKDEPDHGNCNHDHDHDHDHGHAHSHGHSHNQDADEGPAHPGHGCAMHMNHYKVHADLFDLANVPLTMELELLRREAANSFDKEMWEMSIEERVAAVPHHKTRGNELFQAADYEQAIDQYSRALAHIESLTKASVKVGGPVSVEIVEQISTYKAPCLLNLAACHLKQKDFPEAISMATMAIEADSKNPKAYFRRAQAHFQRGRDLDKALEDVETARSLNTAADSAVDKLYQDIKAGLAKQAQEDKSRFRHVFG